MGRQLYPVPPYVLVMFHCNNIPVRSQLNPIRAAVVTGNGFGPSGEVRAAIGIGIPRTWCLTHDDAGPSGEDCAAVGIVSF